LNLQCSGFISGSANTSVKNVIISCAYFVTALIFRAKDLNNSRESEELKVTTRRMMTARWKKMRMNMMIWMASLMMVVMITPALTTPFIFESSSATTSGGNPFCCYHLITC
jgi:hypothetical protein